LKSFYLALSGTHWLYLALIYFAILSLLCPNFVKNSTVMNQQKLFSVIGTKWAKVFCSFFWLYLICPAGQIFCSSEQSKVCFEALEINFVPQNPCRCRGLENGSEVAVFMNFKLGYDE